MERLVILGLLLLSACGKTLLAEATPERPGIYLRALLFMGVAFASGLLLVTGLGWWGRRRAKRERSKELH